MNKFSLLVIVLCAEILSAGAQTNTFPSTGNVGIGTLNPHAPLHVNSELNAVSALRIGYANASGNINVPLKGSPGGYNIDFYGWRDVQADQIGARIRAERINVYLANNALVQGMDLVFSTSIGGSQTDLTEKMRVTNEGNVGIGTKDPMQKFVVSNSGQMGFEVYLDPGLVGLQAYNRATSAYSRMQLEASNFAFTRGNVGIGTTDTKGYMFAVAGSMIAESVKVKLQGTWPDFVFTKEYVLPTLAETEKHIKEKGHLPGIPSAVEVEKNGIELGEMNKKLLQKIEELTLHLIEQDKKSKIQESMNQEMQSKISSLSDQILILKAKNK